MELKQLFSVVQRWWWLALLPALLGILLALPSLRGVINPETTYTVGVRFTASQQPTSQTASTFEDQSYIPWLASEYAVINLAAWLRTDSFAREVSAALAANNLEIPADNLRAVIRSDAVRSIMTIYIDWPNRDQLEQIANTAVRVLVEKNTLYFPQFGDTKAIVQPLDNVIVAPVQPALTSRLQPLIRALIGFGAGIALMFLAEYLDPRIRSREEAEQATGLATLAEIPKN
jgi:capsular polysaccharide biosynthesis protein